MSVAPTTALAKDLERVGRMPAPAPVRVRRELANLRQAFWAVAREEQARSKRLERQMGALFEGLGNVLADMEADCTGKAPRTITEFKLELEHQLDCNVYNNSKA